MEVTGLHGCRLTGGEKKPTDGVIEKQITEADHVAL